MQTTAITAKNQLTLPAEIRRILKVGPGDRVLFRLAEDGRVLVEPETLPVSALKGLVKSGLDRAPTVAEMDDAIAEAVSDRQEGRHDRD